MNNDKGDRIAVFGIGVVGLVLVLLTMAVQLVLIWAVVKIVQFVVG